MNELQQNMHSLKDQWDKHNRGRFLELFQNGEGVDFVIEVQQKNGDQVEKTEFNVHKFVLIANSDVFRTMFRQDATTESREGRMQIKDSTATAVRQMLNYMYAGTLPLEYNATKDSVVLLHIAHKYQVLPLLEFLEHIFIKRVQRKRSASHRRDVPFLCLENLFDRLNLVDLHQLNSLKSACSQMILKNLKTLTKTGKWTELKSNSPQLVLSALEECEHMPKFCPHCDHQPKRCVEIVCIDCWHSLTAAGTQIHNIFMEYYPFFPLVLGGTYILLALWKW